MSKRALWPALQDHHMPMQGLNLKKLFANDLARGERITAEAAGIALYEHNVITQGVIWDIDLRSVGVELGKRVATPTHRPDRVRVGRFSRDYDPPPSSF